LNAYYKSKEKQKKVNLQNELPIFVSANQPKLDDGR
jgi:hypothetical protein